MSKGGGGTNTVTNSAPPAEVLAAYNDVIGKAQNVAATPLQQYNGQIVAGFTPDQTSAMSTINNAQGIANPYINNANNLYSGTALSPQDYGNAVQQYASPYTQQVVDATRANLNENDAQQQLGIAGNAIKAGAYGGDRAGIASAELARQQKLANDQTIGNLYNSGYTNAQGALAQQQGVQQSAASGISGLGNQAQSSALNGANAQLQSGALQQQLNQENLNVPYQQFQTEQQYPFQTTQYLANIAEGIGGSSGGTSTTNAPGPSVGSQLGGLGLAGLSLAGSFKRGGSVKYANGGIVGYDSGGSVMPGYMDMSHVFSGLPSDINVSIVPKTAPAPGHNSIPKAESTHTSAEGNPIKDAINTGLGGARIYKGSNNVGNGISNAYHSFMGDPVSALPDNTAFGNAGNGLLSNILTPAGDVSAISPSIASGANLAGMTSGAEGLGGISGASSFVPEATSSLMPAFASAAGDTALTTAATDAAASSFADLLPELAFLFKNGGSVKKYADGGEIADDDLDEYGDDSGIDSLYPEEDNSSSIVNAPQGIAAPSKSDKSPDLSQALLATGLAMMAGRSPYAGVNVGNAGLAGMQNLSGQKQAQAKAQLLADQADRWKKTLEERANYHTALANRGIGELDTVAKRLMSDNPELTPTQAYLQANGLIRGSGRATSLSAKQTAPASPPMIASNGQIPVVAPNGSVSTNSKAVTLPLSDEGNEFKPNQYAALNGSNGTIKDAPKASIPAQLSGDMFLQTLDPDRARLIKKIGDANMDLTTALARLPGDERQGIISDVTRYNPNFNQNDYKGLVAFKQGKQGQALKPINTAQEHLALLSPLVDAMANGNNQAVNKISNSISPTFGNTDITNFDAAKGLVAAEVSKAAIGGVGGEHEREQLEMKLSNTKTPEQLKGVMKQFVGLMNGQLASTEQQYRFSTQKKDFLTNPDILSPMARANYLTYKNEQGPDASAPSATAPFSANNPLSSRNQSSSSKAKDIDSEQAIKAAKNAVADGKSRQAVAQRLKDAGIDPAKAGL